MVISFCESLRGFREHRGGDTPTDSRQGTKEVDVTMPDYLLVCTDLVQDRVNAAAQLLPQIVVEAQLGQEHEHVFAGRLRTASGQTEYPNSFSPATVTLHRPCAGALHANSLRDVLHGPHYLPRRASPQAIHSQGAFGTLDSVAGSLMVCLIDELGSRVQGRL
jgi:hypothetical protein